MEAACSPLEPAGRDDRLARARDDVLFFGQTYLPHYFTAAPAPFHRDLIKLLDTRNRPVVVAAPRGHAKSTIVSLTYPLHEILFALRHFLVLISETKDQAADALEFIRLELEANPRIHQDFGDLRRLGEWTHDGFTTSTGIKALARGARQRIRSLRNRQWRPDLAVVDDLESDESVVNPRIIRKRLNWVRQEVYGAVEDGCSFFVIGNLLAKRSVLGHLLFDDDLADVVERRIYRAIDDVTGEPLWPAHWSLEKLAAKKAFMGSVGFAKEYLCNPEDPEGDFQEKWIRYYGEGEVAGRELDVFTFCDPSVKDSATSDFKAIVTIGLDRANMVYYCLHAFIRRVSIDAMLRMSWEIHDRWRPILFGFESNGFQEVLKRDYDRMALDRGYCLPLKLVVHTTKKDGRILRLSPLVENGRLRFLRGDPDQERLIEQFIFSREPSVADDGPDACEGAIKLSEDAFYESAPFEFTGGADEDGPHEVDPWEED